MAHALARRPGAAGIAGAGIALALSGSAGLAEGLYGVIESTTSNLPIPFAEIQACAKVEGECHKAVTGTDGTFSIPEIEPGEYELDVILNGEWQAFDVHVEQGMATERLFIIGD